MSESRPRFDTVGTLALAGSVLCWSVMPPLLKAFTPYVDGWTANGIRYPFAALLWLGPLLYQYRLGLVEPWVWKAALLPTAVNLVAQTLWAWLPYYMQATHMGFLARLSVVFGIAGGLILFDDERPLMRKPLFWAGVCTCAAGFVTMNLPHLGGMSGKDGMGVMLVLVCSVFYGLYGVSVRYCMRGTKAWVAFPVISLYTSVFLFGGMFLLGEPARVLEAPGWILTLLLISSVVGIAAAHTLFYTSLNHLGVAITTGSQLLAPFFTVLWAFLFLEERLTLVEWIGGVALVAGGCLLIRAQTVLAPPSLDPEKAPIEPKLPD